MWSKVGIKSFLNFKLWNFKISSEFLEKFYVRLEKYATWFFVNFVVCLFPIVISALISWKVSDDIFVSYISFIYTLLISGLYVYFNSGKESHFTIWLTMFFTFLFLVFYVVFPNVLQKEQVTAIRSNYFSISIGTFILSLLMSFALNRKGIEDQVQAKLSKLAQQRATDIEGAVNNMFDTLKNENL